MFRRFIYNWQLKLLALILSLVMWGFIVGQDKVEMTIEVPVELTGIPVEMVVVGNVVSKIYVRVSGPSTLVDRVVRVGLGKRLDLTGMGPGKHVFQVQSESLRLPSGVSITRVIPGILVIKLVHRDICKIPALLKARLE